MRAQDSLWNKIQDIKEGKEKQMQNGATNDAREFDDANSLSVGFLFLGEDRREKTKKNW